MSSGGWLTTKKRGRDDEAIARDRKRALQMRQQQRPAPTGGRSRKKKTRHGYELNDFVEADEEELSECSGDSEEEEGDDDESSGDTTRNIAAGDKMPVTTKSIIVARASRANGYNRTRDRNNVHPNDDDDDDDDDVLTYDESCGSEENLANDPCVTMPKTHDKLAPSRNNQRTKRDFHGDWSRDDDDDEPEWLDDVSDLKTKGMTPAGSILDDDDSSNEDGTLFRSFSTQSRRPAPLSQQSKGHTGAFGTWKRPKEGKENHQLKGKPQVFDLLSSDNEETSTRPPTKSRFFSVKSSRPLDSLATSRGTTAPTTSNSSASSSRKANQQISSDSDSNDDLDWLDRRPRSCKPSKLAGDDETENKSFLKAGQKVSTAAKDDEIDLIDTPHKVQVDPFSRKKAKDNKDCSKNSSEVGQLSSLSIDFPPVHETSKVSKKKLVVREDDDKDEDSSAPVNSIPTRHHMDDSSMDEDEAAALSWAIEASKNEINHRETLKALPTSIPIAPKVDDEDPSVMIESNNQSSNTRGDDDASVARFVLETANSLSLQVLETMNRWIQHHTDSDDDANNKNNNNNNGIPLGLLVDGALVVNGFTKNDSPDPSWISHEVMQKICPNVELKDYQLIGVNWMALLHRMKCNVGGNFSTNVNGILADEMGLGKTVQTIAFLAWLKYSAAEDKELQRSFHENKKARASCGGDDVFLDGDQNVVSLVNSDEDDTPQAPHPMRKQLPHIVITPVSVVDNWAREFQKFCPELNVVVYQGDQDERKDIRRDLRRYLQGEGDYEPVDKFKFDYMVVDEGHILKSPTSSRYKRMDRMQTNHRLLLTGTPVQNSTNELMALLCFLMPLFTGRRSRDGYVSHDGGKSMLKHFVNIDKGSSDVSPYDKLKRLFAPFVLRRKKDDVLKQILPEKKRRVEKLKVDDATMAAYNAILAKHYLNTQTGTSTDYKARLALFNELRKCANHTLLLRTRHNTPPETDKLARLLKKYKHFAGDSYTVEDVKAVLKNMNDLEIHFAAKDIVERFPRCKNELSPYMLEDEALFSSAKFLRLRELMPKLLSEGHRVLIFSQWTKLLDLIGIFMDYLDYKFLRLDGSVMARDRQELIDRFTEDSSYQVFLLSTRAGGVGINLTVADTCIIHDLDFNPNNDHQAEDRCHRIGQKKEVTVIKLVTTKTVDELIYNMQQRKEQMKEAIMGTNEGSESFKDDMECILQMAFDQYRRQLLREPLELGTDHAGIAVDSGICDTKADEEYLETSTASNLASKTRVKLESDEAHDNNVITTLPVVKIESSGSTLKTEADFTEKVDSCYPGTAVNSEIFIDEAFSASSDVFTPSNMHNSYRSEIKSTEPLVTTYIAEVKNEQLGSTSIPCFGPKQRLPCSDGKVTILIESDDEDIESVPAKNTPLTIMSPSCRVSESHKAVRSDSNDLPLGKTNVDDPLEDESEYSVMVI